MLFSGVMALQLHTISYKYPHTDKIALSEISYTFSRGTTAIVGPNGAGKSTLVKLLTGLLTPTSGSISAQLPDGTCLPPGQLHQAVLFQEPSHLYLTIRQNITMHFKPTPDEDAPVYDALEKAGLDKVVKRLPDGIDTLVGAGFGGRTDLSGGQWQRLALARLIYQDAPVIILDEPVASLDPQGERAVFELFSQLAQSRVIIFTTHRYDSIPSNTKIVVLVDGIISESGTHAELLQKQHDYWSLYMAEASNKAVPILAGQPGLADHAIHAMNGQTNRKTNLSLAEFALRPHAPSPETASPSNPASESSSQLAGALSNGRVDAPPASDSFEDSSLAHSAPSSPSTAPASLPPTPLAPASRLRRKHPALLPALLALMLILGMGTGFLLHARGYGLAPSTLHRSVPHADPRGKSSPTLIPSASLYPPLAASYAGTVADLMTKEKTTLLLTDIQQNQERIHGTFQGLGLLGPFKGTVTPSGQVQFTVTIYVGEETLVFEGNIKVGGDMAGSFAVLNHHRQLTGEAGLWNVAASP